MSVLFRGHGLLLLLFLLWLNALFASDPAVEVHSLYENGEYAKAAELAATIRDRSPDLFLYHGLALARLERFDQARGALQRGRELYPGDKRFPLELAGVAYRGKNIAEAKSHLRQALRIDPADEYGNEFLGSLHLLEGNIPATLRYWNRIDKPLIQDVDFQPPPNVHPLLRERAVVIAGGQILTLKRLRATEGNLDRLGVFARRQFELGPRSDQRFDLTLRLLPVESPLTGWLGRLLPMARGLPYQTVFFDRHNMARRAINFRSLWRWDINKRRIDLKLEGPIRLNPRRGYRLIFDARDENWDITRTYRPSGGTPEALQLRRIGAGGDLVFALNEKVEWTTGLRLTRRQFQNDGGASVFADSWSFEQRNQLDYHLLDLPERRIAVDSFARLRTGRLFSGASSRFAMAEGGLSGFWKPEAGGNVWEAHTQLRAGKTFGETPFDEFFQLGMERDNDLWLRGHVGTREGRKGNAPLGTDYALVQTDFDRQVAKFRFVRLKAGPFFDAGWISGPSSPFGSHGWLYDAGLQAKVAVAGGVTWSFVYGRDLRGGHGAFYSSVQY